MTSKNGSCGHEKQHSRLGTMSKKGKTQKKQRFKKDLAKTRLEMANAATRVLLDDVSVSQRCSGTWIQPKRACAGMSV